MTELIRCLGEAFSRLTIEFESYETALITQSSSAIPNNAIPRITTTTIVY